jgi:hypothetical protein
VPAAPGYPSDRSDECDLTVIVACVEASSSIGRCLAALDDACRHIRAQIVVVDASNDDTAAMARSRGPAVEILQFPAGVLVPSLWAAGLQVARGAAVAFTLGQMIVSPTWASGLLAGLGRADGVGGPLSLAPDAGLVDSAVFCLRYSAFLPVVMSEGPITGEIAGDNAAYRRERLESHRPSIEEGFWEVDFHRQLRAEGGTLAASAQALAMFSGAPPFTNVAWHRYRHGRDFGTGRLERGESAFRLLAAAPLVPAVLAWRAGRRVLRQPGLRGRFVLALPVFLVLATCWAAGEASAAWS